MQFPASYATSDWVEEQRGRDEVDVVIPYAFDMPRSLSEPLPDGIAPTDRLVHTLLIVADDDFALHYFYTEACSWTEFRRITLENDIDVEEAGLYEQDVNVFAEDAVKTNEANQALGEHLADLYGQPVFMYDADSARRMMGRQSTPSGCGHPFSIPVPVEIKGRSDISVSACGACGQPRTVDSNGDEYDRNGVLSRLRPDSAVQVIDAGSDYRLLEAEIGVSDAVDTIVAFLTKEIDAELSISATPEVGEHVLLLELNDVIAGYAEWGQLRGLPNLQQLYVIPEARKNGYAKAILSKWVQTYVDADTFYADRPNEAGEAVLESLGLLNDSNGPSAVPYQTYWPIMVEPSADSPVFRTIQESLNRAAE